MKKIIISLALSISVLTLQSCKEKSATDTDAITTAKVPVPVQASFTTKYAAATDVVWEDAHEGNKQSYKAKFLLNGKKMKAEFDAAGVFIKEKADD